MRSGVYSITHIPSGRAYIGSAAYVASRWANHRHRLRQGKHHVAALQAAWNADGEDAFRWKHLIVCPIEDLRRVETEMIQSLRPAFNTRGLRDVGVKHTPEGIAKIAEATRSRYVVRDGLTLRELALRHGVYPKTVQKRLERGWTLDDALGIPADPKHRPR